MTSLLAIDKLFGLLAGAKRIGGNFRNFENALMYQIYTGADPVGVIDFDEQALTVQQRLHAQSMDLMKVHVDAVNALPVLEPLMTKDQKTSSLTLQAERVTDVAAVLPELRERIRKRLGFLVRHAPSTVEDAGHGLFLDGRAMAGDVVAFVPGTVYSIDQRRKIPGYPNLVRENLTLTSRLDQVIIDSDDDDAMKRYLHMEWDNEQERNPYWSMINCFAIGHYVNHPPKGVKDKVRPLMVDFDIKDVQKEGALRYFPYRAAKGSSLWFRSFFLAETSSTVKGLVLVATEDIEDEEIFRNYRFNPRVPNLPEWYHDPDPKMTEFRWETD